jgi:hypothetical protein
MFQIRFINQIRKYGQKDTLWNIYIKRDQNSQSLDTISGTVRHHIIIYINDNHPFKMLCLF